MVIHLNTTTRNLPIASLEVRGREEEEGGERGKWKGERVRREEGTSEEERE
jgi:hypothetical protein